jgi:hypothetical protein
MRTLSSGRGSRSRGNGRGILIGLLVLILLAAGVLLVYLAEREPPVITPAPVAGVLGVSTPLGFQVSDHRSGLQQVKVVLTQNNQSKVLFAKRFERTTWIGQIGPETLSEEIILDTGKLQLEDGPAQLIFTAVDYSLWGFGAGNATRVVVDLNFDTQPPHVVRLDSPRYIRPGGAGIVMYKITEEVAQHGVNINGYFHPGFPVAGKEDVYGAIIALPFDSSEINDAHVVAIDLAGNAGKAPFGMIVKNKTFKHDTINIPDSFLSLKIPEFSQYYPEMTGESIEQFVYINTKVRKDNRDAIAKLCMNPMAEKLWSGRFNRMAGAGRAGYADHRNYVYKGKTVDKQVHLGMDIASVRHAPVKAANKGKVVFTNYLGIYGNMVLLDHGTGVFTLYSHMSQIGVVPGDIVLQDEVLGATGTTGMAGGDHLHFGVLVNGIIVNPLEWWDGSWLDLHIESYLQ